MKGKYITFLFVLLLLISGNVRLYASGIDSFFKAGFVTLGLSNEAGSMIFINPKDITKSTFCSSFNLGINISLINLIGFETGINYIYTDKPDLGVFSDITDNIGYYSHFYIVYDRTSKTGVGFLNAAQKHQMAYVFTKSPILYFKNFSLDLVSRAFLSNESYDYLPMYIGLNVAFYY